MNDEITQGVKNALERGVTLESAVKSFINAGYNLQEVNEVASALSNSVSSLVADSPSPAARQFVSNSPPANPISSNSQVNSVAKSPLYTLPQLQPTLLSPPLQKPAIVSPPHISDLSTLVSTPQFPENKSGVSKTKVIALTIVLLVLLALLGVSIFAKDWVASLFA